MYLQLSAVFGAATVIGTQSDFQEILVQIINNKAIKFI